MCKPCVTSATFVVSLRFPLLQFGPLLLFVDGEPEEPVGARLHAHNDDVPVHGPVPVHRAVDQQARVPVLFTSSTIQGTAATGVVHDVHVAVHEVALVHAQTALKTLKSSKTKSIDVFFYINLL